MVWPAWSAGNMPLDTAGFPEAPWTHLMGSLPRLQRKLRLALPCIGLDGLGAGLRTLHWKDCEIVYAFDVDEALLAPLLAMHGPIGLGGHVKVGPTIGDLMKEDVTSWTRVDLLVSGPPCPPWSSIGQRQGVADPRALVFKKVTEAICHQGRLGCYGFIVEMVEGMDQRSGRCSTSASGAACSPYSCWLEQLRREAPMFTILCWPMNTALFLPQSRHRLYTVGFHCDLLLGDAIPPPLPPPLPAVPLELLLHKGLKPIDEDRLSKQHQSHLAVAKGMIHRRHVHTPIGLEGVTACIAVDRCPERAWGLPVRWDGLVNTLRTDNEHVWLYRFDGAGQVLLSRCLHPVERLSLQGFPVDLASYMSKAALMRATGNAFSVPVIIAVFRHWLCFVARTHAFGYVDISLAQKQLWFAEQELLKRRRLNDERHKVALTERLSQLAVHLAYRSRRPDCQQPIGLGLERCSLSVSEAGVPSFVAFVNGPAGRCLNPPEPISSPRAGISHGGTPSMRWTA